MKKAVQFGSGNIGRGFLGQLFCQSGYETVFIDIDKRVVDTLNQKQSYTIEIVGEKTQTITIDKVRALNAKELEQVAEELKDADIAATAVGNAALPQIAPLVAKGIERRVDSGVKKPLNIIICENLLHASRIFREYILSHLEDSYKAYVENNLGLVESVVSRMVPILPEKIRSKDPTFVRVEEYCILPVDGKAFKGATPQIKGLAPSDNIKAYERRKLYTHNAGHAICAYLGYLKSYEYVWQSLEDPRIQRIVRDALEETGRALIQQEKFAPKEQWEHVEDLLHRFSNKALGDTVYRVGRDPLRKLAKEDRLIGSATLAEKYGIKPRNVCQGIVAALKYDYEEDAQAVKLQSYLKSKGVDWVLANICEIDPEEQIGKLVKMYYN